MAENISVLELLTAYNTELLESKIELTKRMETINQAIRDCEIAIDALNKFPHWKSTQEPETTERLPKVGDQLVWVFDSADGFESGKSYRVIECDQDSFGVMVCFGNTYHFPYFAWREYFRFADEEEVEQPETTERLPKVGDQLVAICGTDEFLTKEKTYQVIKTWNDTKSEWFGIINDNGNTYPFAHSFWREFFCFADELKTEPKPPYPIETGQERAKEDCC